MRPSALGVDPQTIFSTALGHDDVEAMRATFAPGNLTQPYHSVNTDVNKRSVTQHRRSPPHFSLTPATAGAAVVQTPIP
jgi:hypothetical protein